MTKRQLTFWLILAIGLGMAVSACGGSGGEGDDAAQTAAQASVGDPKAGEVKYNEVCIACHGANGQGVENLGKPFTTSDFVESQTDEELLAFVKTGRPVGDPLNTTGVDMPPKGGNPALTDDQILDIIAYIRTLQ